VTIVAAAAGLAVCATAAGQTPAADGKPAADEVAKAEAAPKGILPLPDVGGDFWTRPVLTGDWGGARSDLADKGIRLNLDWVQTVQGVVSGGADRAARYGGSLDYLISLDLDRMGAVPGALVQFRAETRYGESVNNIAGPLAPVDTDGFFPLSADDIPFTITDLTYYQFLSEHFGAFVGKIDTLNGDPNPFASGRGNTQFLNSALVFPTVAVLAVPYSTLAAGVIVMPVPNITITSMFMNTADASTTTGFGGFGEGTTWSTEADFQYALGELPGGMNVGVIYAWDQSFVDFGSRLVFQPGQGLAVPTKNETWAVYWSGWQYLHTVDKVTTPIDMDFGALPGVQGFGLFARAGIADQDTSPIKWDFSIGFGGQGVIPGREHDLYGVGYYYSGLDRGRLTGALGFHNNAQAFEAFYGLAITPAAQLTFDLQVGSGPWPNLDPALVLGMRLYLNF